MQNELKADGINYLNRTLSEYRAQLDPKSISLIEAMIELLNE